MLYGSGCFTGSFFKKSPLAAGGKISTRPVTWPGGCRIDNQVKIRGFRIELGEIEKELKQPGRIKTLKSVHFIDDTFNIPVERFKKILRMMIKNKFEFKWHSYFRCQFADREMAALMKESGCEGGFLGLESGNNQILKNMNKNANHQKYRKGIELLKEYGIVTLIPTIL